MSSRLRAALLAATAVAVVVAAPTAAQALTLNVAVPKVLNASLTVPSLLGGTTVTLPGIVDPTAPAAHDTEPVVLTGAAFPGWSAPANLTVQPPLMDILLPGGDGHNHYAEPLVDTGAALGAGTPIGRLLGYRWNPAAGRFDQIPFQVDERFTRYLDNSASGFAIYSGQDQHTTYAYDGPGDREGFRYTADGPPSDPCRAQPASPPAHDPVPGLDDNDELAFMASDAGPKAPAGAPLPAGITDARLVTVVDPQRPTAAPGYVYVMRAGAGGPAPAFTVANGYVHYQRDADADLYAFSQSSYADYGNAAQGVYCDANGNVVRDANGVPRIGRRRPRDTATVTTGRYRFRYDGRWLMTDIRISPDGGATYGPDLVDRFKARAFAQDPASQTPCCGFEEEDTNWGGSSTLLGERVGPVRAIRETWGADSSTNAIRQETFYRDEVRQKIWLRVHPIPPLDGIYAQWDFNAGRVDRFYNAHNPQGVPIDGRDDEVFGNLDDPCNPRYDANPISAFDQGYRTLYRELQLCQLPYHQSVDLPDLTFSDLNAALGWSETSGPNGTIVDRVSADAQTLTPGGLAQSLLAVPYYRDDSCFDDGTGTDPGPKLHLRSGDEPATAADGTPRRCWTPADGVPDGSDHYYQGSIGTHGVHILAIADSDNLRLTVPLDEIAADWRMVMLPGRQGADAGERYGRGFEKPLLASVGPG